MKQSIYMSIFCCTFMASQLNAVDCPEANYLGEKWEDLIKDRSITMEGGEMFKIVDMKKWGEYKKPVKACTVNVDDDYKPANPIVGYQKLCTYRRTCGPQIQTVVVLGV